LPRPLALAFLACNKNAARYRLDASYLYRCENLAAALAEAGHETHCGHFATCPPRRFDVVVLHRPRLTWRLRWLLARLRREGTRIVADVDDLVFLPELASVSPGVLNGVAPLAEVTALFSANKAALAAVDQITVSTEPLAEELRQALPQASSLVLPNAVPHAWLGLPASPVAGPRRIISYLPGTRSHDRDFARVAPALTTLLRRHPALMLEVTGPGSYALDVPAAQCLRHVRQPFHAYTDTIRRARVNLLPLESTRFNRCKSALKVIEAGFWQVPTVCSPLPDATRFEGSGAHIAQTDAEWLASLEALATDDAYHRSQAAGLRERVLARADIRVLARTWLAFVTRDEAAP
jgi:hypothetical protein